MLDFLKDKLINVRLLLIKGVNSLTVTIKVTRNTVYDNDNGNKNKPTDRRTINDKVTLRLFLYERLLKHITYNVYAVFIINRHLNITLPFSF